MRDSLKKSIGGPEDGLRVNLGQIKCLLLYFADYAVSKPQIWLNCSEDFQFVNDSKGGRCVPICQQWSPYSPLLVRISDIFIIISAAFSLVAGLGVLVLGCIRYKRM